MAHIRIQRLAARNREEGATDYREGERPSVREVVNGGPGPEGGEDSRLFHDAADAEKDR